MKIAFIGSGNMAEAMISAVIDRGLIAPRDITASDISDTRRLYIEQEYGITVVSSNRQALSGSDIVVLAIKPQNLTEVMAELSGELQPGQMVISVIAGARIETLRLGLNHVCIVRVMPNTPAQIGQGMSIWMATAEVTEEQKNWAGSILGAMGKEIYVSDEQYMDMATAISGSGPGYVFLFIECLIEAAVHIGLPHDMARELVLQTVLGSAQFAEKSGKPPAELRRMVTSPGGTTAAALLQFEQGQLSELVRQAVSAAHQRAKELGQQG